MPKYAVRFSHWLARPTRWWPIALFVIGVPICYGFPFEWPESWWEPLVVIGILCLVAWGRSKRYWPSAEVWYDGELTWIRTSRGLHPFQLCELKRVRVLRRDLDGDDLHMSRMFWRGGTAPDPVEIEFEEKTPLGWRVRFEFRERYGRGRLRAKEEFRSWMSAVNRRTSPLRA